MQSTTKTNIKRRERRTRTKNIKDGPFPPALSTFNRHHSPRTQSSSSLPSHSLVLLSSSFDPVLLLFFLFLHFPFPCIHINTLVFIHRLSYLTEQLALLSIMAQQPQSSLSSNTSTMVQINQPSTDKILVPSTSPSSSLSQQAHTPAPISTDPKGLKDIDRIRLKLRPALLYVVSTAQFFDIG